MNYSAIFTTIMNGSRGLLLTLIIAMLPSTVLAQNQAGWTWDSCSDPSREFHLTKTDGAGNLICNGKIDTLYSWGVKAKIDTVKKQQWTGPYMYQGKPHAIFTLPSSYATFGYGPYAIRFRLKDTTKLKFVPNAAYTICNTVSAAERENTVFLRHFPLGGVPGNNTILDYILCGMGPVHSWSYGTTEHYQEMIREKSWVDQNKTNYRFYELYVKTPAGDDVIPANLDGHAFNEGVWLDNLRKHQASQPGEIFYNPSVSDKTRSAHFSTRWANYINPNTRNPNPNPNPAPNAALTFRDFLNSTFRDNRGRTLTLGGNRQCSSQGVTNVVTPCNWEFRSPSSIVVNLATGVVRYYQAQSSANICFTGEGYPGAQCLGSMSRY